METVSEIYHVGESRKWSDSNPEALDVKRGDISFLAIWACMVKTVWFSFKNHQVFSSDLIISIGITSNVKDLNKPETQKIFRKKKDLR